MATRQGLVADGVMDVRKKFGANVRRIRAAAGLSQEELAHNAGLHTTYLSGVENGHRNPSIDAVDRLAVALKVEIGELFVEAAE